jgi:hypothetical protein
LDEVDDTSIFKTGPLASLSTISDLVNALQPSLTSTIAKRFSALAHTGDDGRQPATAAFWGRAVADGHRPSICDNVLYHAWS